VRWNAYPAVVEDVGARLAQELKRLRMVHAHAGALQDLQAGAVDAGDLIVRKLAERRRDEC